MRMNKRHLLGLVAALPLAWLTACGGGNNGNDASVRLVNASTGYASLDLTVKDADSPQITGVEFGAGSAYTGVPSGDVSNVLTATGSTTELLTQTRSLGSGGKYTIVAFGVEGALKSVITKDSQSAADSNKTKVSVLNAGTDEVDVYLTGTDETLESSTPVVSGADPNGTQSGFTTVASGTYRLRVTGAGDTDDLRLDVPAVTLDSTKVLTIVVTPGQGGVLMHAIGVVQDGDVTPYLNTQARLRMVAAVGATAPFSSVSMCAGSTVLGTNVGSFTVGKYVLVNSGAQTLTTTVDGTALAPKQITVTAGSDTTLLVTGTSPATATVNVIADDNTLPTVSTKYKIRVVHAAPSLAGQSVTLKVASGQVGDAQPLGGASAYDDLTASGEVSIEIATPADGTIYSVDKTPVSKGVYTVFVRDSSTGVIAEFTPER
jgi:hypothetical protein